MYSMVIIMRMTSMSKALLRLAKKHGGKKAQKVLSRGIRAAPKYGLTAAELGTEAAYTAAGSGLGGILTASMGESIPRALGRSAVEFGVAMPASIAARTGVNVALNAIPMTRNLSPGVKGTIANLAGMVPDMFLAPKVAEAVVPYEFQGLGEAVSSENPGVGTVDQAAADRTELQPFETIPAEHRMATMSVPELMAQHGATTVGVAPEALHMVNYGRKAMQDHYMRGMSQAPEHWSHFRGARNVG